MAIEVGHTHAFAGFPESMRGRKMLVIADRGELLLVRFANGTERTISRGDVGAESDPLAPGIDEPCLICGGTKVVLIHQRDEEHPWVSRVVGGKPCPNCAHPTFESITAS